MTKQPHHVWLTEMRWHDGVWRIGPVFALYTRHQARWELAKARASSTLNPDCWRIAKYVRVNTRANKTRK